MSRSPLAHTAGALGAGFLLLSLAGCGGPPAPSAPAPRTEAAEDTVDVGYGTLPRGRVTGAVASVSGERLAQNTRAVRVEELLQGRVAGVQVIRLANGGYRVRIRGAAGEGEPLFVVDGMPVHSLYPGSALNGINPADVARIDVLKDAASTAIYGSRGAHGVILITTRRPGT